MNRIRLASAACIISAAFATGSAMADSWTGTSVITKLEQTGKHNIHIHISPTPSGTGCSLAYLAFVQETGTYSYNPDYKDIAPAIMAAFLYGKTVDILYDGCMNNALKVTGIKVNQ